MTETPPVDPLAQATGVWRPDLNPKQFDLLYARKPITLVSGPRMTGKSMGICHAVCEHMWNVNGSRVGIFVTSYKVATDGGAWTDLIDYAVKEWMGDDGQGNLNPVRAGDQPGDDPDAEFRYTTFVRGSTDADGNPVGTPKLDAKSRTPFFRIQNRFGGQSECRVFSVDNENEIEAKTRGLRLSAVWCVELSTFKTRKIFEQTILLLRAHGVPDDKMFWISDTNPPEEGEDHWSHKMFYRDRLDPDYKDKIHQAKLGLIEILLDDNPKLSADKRSILENTYLDSPDEYDRFVLGKWPKSGTRRLELFSDLIVPSIHFPQGKIDVPRDTETLVTGWDLGNKNSACVILCIPIIQGVPHICFLEEVVHIDEEISTKDFTLEVLDKMIAINEHYKKIWPTFPGFKWRHWSDNSSTDYYRASTGDVDSAIVYKETNGQIDLVGVEKSDHTVEDDVKLLRMFLREKRIFIGDNCPQLKACLQKIRRGDKKILDPKDKFKHVLDSGRYAIRSETLEYLHAPERVIDPKAPPQLQSFSIRR